MDPWRTAIASTKDGEIRLRGYDVADLMRAATFTDTIFLLHRGQMPSPAERRLLDAILSGVADHGAGSPSCAAARLAASGNRQSLSSAIAAGILAVGDEHGGAGSTCMEMIAVGVERSSRESVTLAEAARRTAADYRASGRRVPGLGHRVHTRDPRTPVLFGLARDHGLAGSGIDFMEALEAAVRDTVTALRDTVLSDTALSDTVRPLPINIDGALAAVLHDLGFPPQFGRLLFLIGRVAGLSAEVSEELSRERPMRIRIPVEYDGEAPRSLE